MRNRSLAEGQALVSDWAASGLSQAEFCEQTGVKYCTLLYWKRRMRKVSGTETATKYQKQFAGNISSGNSAGAVRITLGEVEVSFANLPPVAWLRDFVCFLLEMGVTIDKMEKSQ